MRRWLPLALIGGCLAFATAVYARLPDRMPVHWGLDGTADRYGSRVEGAFFLPVIMLVVWAVMRWLPTIDPRRANYAKFTDTYDTLVITVLTVFAALHVVTVGIALGWPISIARAAPALIGLLFVVLGNILPRSRPNWWFGIRSPWTLSSDRVWARTHRIGGYLLVAAGLLFLVAAALPSPWTYALAMSAAVAASVGSVAYSYVVWKRETAQ
jgi:uncharacterized membrane protein